MLKQNNRENCKVRTKSVSTPRQLKIMKKQNISCFTPDNFCSTWIIGSRVVGPIRWYQSWLEKWLMPPWSWAASWLETKDSVALPRTDHSLGDHLHQSNYTLVVEILRISWTDGNLQQGLWARHMPNCALKRQQPVSNYSSLLQPLTTACWEVYN